MTDNTNSPAPRPTRSGPLLRDPAHHSLLTSLQVVDSADLLYLSRQTGIPYHRIAEHINDLAAQGLLAPAQDHPPASASPLLRLTKAGRTAHDATRRWRFRARTLALLAALPFSSR